MLKALHEIILRELGNVKKEISAYGDDKKLWAISGEIKNSGGNLCLHLCGNIQHYIGTVMGDTGYVRKRDLEFSRKDVPRQELLAEVDNTIKSVNTAFGKMKEDDLKKEFPTEVHLGKVSTGYFLTHLVSHLTYHLGQINYHRRQG
jgi:uncharacterized damage-inducible protein DinB